MILAENVGNSSTAFGIYSEGSCVIIAPLTDRIDEEEPWLNLEGLHLISERNPAQ
ncbi:MAG TPA: hypothetical protein VMX75_06520 [Spirochaetia bacterium]|nr:hypothetical protein [Spirochaetia bacterium]